MTLMVDQPRRVYSCCSSSRGTKRHCPPCGVYRHIPGDLHVHMGIGTTPQGVRLYPQDPSPPLADPSSPPPHTLHRRATTACLFVERRSTIGSVHPHPLVRPRPQRTSSPAVPNQHNLAWPGTPRRSDPGFCGSLPHTPLSYPTTMGSALVRSGDISGHPGLYTLPPTWLPIKASPGEG